MPPHNYLEEQILLGMLLINKTLITAIVPLITAECFFLESNQTIYRNLLEVYKKNRMYSSELLYSMAYNKLLKEIGGVEKIMSLMKQSQIFTLSINLNKYAEDIIKDINNNYTKRLMIQFAYNIIKLAHVRTFPSHQLYNRAYDYLCTTSSQIPKHSIIDFKELVGEFLVEVKTNYDKKTIIQDEIILKYKNHIVSGFQALDKLTDGIPQGDLFVIAGRPSMGKTSFAINIIDNLINNINIGISTFSLEMSKMQILAKLVSINSTIPIKDILHNRINSDDLQSITQTCKKLLDSQIYLNDTPDMSIDYIEYTCKLLHKETRYIEIIFIDYLQLIQVEEFNYATRTQELSYITRKLKLLAQALNIPVVILSQLNRSIETRADKKPLLSDLKESGCLSTKSKIYLKNIQKLNILNTFILNNNIEVVFNKKIQSKKNIINYSSNNIGLCIHYLYKIIIQFKFKKAISATYNHRIYGEQEWLKQHHIIDQSNNIQQTLYNTQEKKLEYLYIKQIIYINKDKTYDIKAPQSLFFIYEEVILHNSIEQDADIVIILYQKYKNENLLELNKTIDVCLCKNRNGPIGFCQLSLHLPNTRFSEINYDNNSIL